MPRQNLLKSESTEQSMKGELGRSSDMQQGIQRHCEMQQMRNNA
jgi:hypothetical protein